MATRVVFFGTPEFAVPTLDALIAAPEFDVVGAVMQPDKPVGRKQVLTAPPTKVLALQHGIPVMQPKSLKIGKPSGAAFRTWFADLQPDVAVVIAYGKIIPQDILDIPTHGFINVHGSILPKLRGASPIQFAIAEGFTETGVTIMQMDAGMDTGPILSTHVIPLSGTETAASLHHELSGVGAAALVDTLPKYMAGDIAPKPQNDAIATTCGLIQKTDGEIDWTEDAAVIERKIRAFTPWPGCFTYCNDKRIKLLSAHLEDGRLIIDAVQPEGKTAMPYPAFLAGNPNCQLPPA